MSYQNERGNCVAKDEWLQKVIDGQRRVAKAIARDLNGLFYSRLAKRRAAGDNFLEAAKSALDEMNRDPWGKNDH